jgi:predicted RNase H-like nuclease (RuvC/YqgF family)|tara:strand:- start:208 stop:735 length:528 start_codon:yes stop_codon:yes gene_type:complete
MSEQEVVQDVKTEAIAQDVKTEAVNSNDKADDYSVPGYRFKKVNESNKNLEAENMELKSKIKDREIAEAEQKEEYKNLYEEAKADRDKFRDDAQKFYSIEQSRKERLLESFPENLREKMSKLDSETLEQMKTEFTNKIPQVDNSGGGVSGGKVLEWKNLSDSDRKRNFADIMRKK